MIIEDKSPAAARYDFMHVVSSNLEDKPLLEPKHTPDVHFFDHDDVDENDWWD